MNGKFSTLIDNIETVARTIGEKVTPALKVGFDLAIKTVSAINQALAAQSISRQDKIGFRQEAVREVRAAGGGFGVGNVVVRHLGKTYQGPPDQVIRQITNDLINKEVQRRAGNQALAVSTANAVTRPELGAGTVPTRRGGRAGAKDKDSRSAMEIAFLAEAASREVFQNIQDQLDAQFEMGKIMAKNIEIAEAAGKAFAEDFLKRSAEKTDLLKDALQGVGDVLGNQLMNVFDGLIKLETLDFNDAMRHIGAGWQVVNDCWP